MIGTNPSNTLQRQQNPFLLLNPKERGMESKSKSSFSEKREPDYTQVRVQQTYQDKQKDKQINDKKEKAIVYLQKSDNKIDKQSNTIKQLYGMITQLQRQVC